MNISELQLREISISPRLFVKFYLRAVIKPNSATEMVLFSEFCCGCSLKKGTITAAVFYVIWSLVPISSSAKRLQTIQNVQRWGESVSVTKTQHGIRLAFAVIQAICGIFLLFGAIQEKAGMLLTWLFVEPLLVIALTVIYITVLAEVLADDEAAGYVALVFLIIYVLLTVYFLLVVYSYYQTLRERPR